MVRLFSKKKKQSLDEIHEAIHKFMTGALSISQSLKERDSVTTIEDALQAIETVERPKTSQDIEAIGNIVINAVLAAGDDSQNWKLLALTIAHRRYHAKAPEAKLTKKQNQSQIDKSDDGAGHGERLSFYVMFVYFQLIARSEHSLSNFAMKACECLARLALPAGGTRDICALIEHLVYEELDKENIVQLQKDEGGKRALCQAVTKYIVEKKEVSSVLSELIKIASSLIHQDLTLIDSDTIKIDDATAGILGEKREFSLRVSDDGDFQSTINTFIPHNGRGSKTRKLVQSIAELMIWSQTLAMKGDTKYSSTLVDLSSVLDDDDKIIPCVQALQTTIRRTRKKLNASSREQGFYLVSSFQINPDSINLDMIRAGKHGDVTMLQQLATKANNIRLIRLIAERFTDPSKAIAASSIMTLKNNWIRVGEHKGEPNVEVDEITTLKLKMQEATVKATIELLRSKIPKNGEMGDYIIVSFDKKPDIDGAAILVAAAMGTQYANKKSYNCKEKKAVALHLGEEVCDISSFPNVMMLLDKAFAKSQSSASSAENDLSDTKDIQNLIDRHLEPDGTLIIFAASDVKLEQRILKKLKEERRTVHCHIIDEFACRMEREKAKVGDITVTLAWDDECDLDLSAKCPNGDLIYYGNKNGGTETGGGYLDVDMNVQGESTEPVENIFFGDAEKGISADHGHYKIMVRNFGYHGDTVKRGDPVPWRVRLSKDGRYTNINGVCKGSGGPSEVTVVEFEYTGRTVPAPEPVGSAIASSNLVSVTSSRGITMDSISLLMKLREEHSELNTVRGLVENSNGGNDTVEDGAEPVQPQDDPEGTPLMADRNSFEITSRDRLYLNLSKLPTRFHLEVNRSFEGVSTLLDHTASILAKRLIEDRVHVNELENAGYQSDIVAVVRRKLTTFGIGS